MIDWGAIAFVELVLFAVVLFVFAVLYGLRSDWQSTSVGRILLSLVVGVVVMLCGFIAMALNLPAPTWGFALVFAGLDVAAVGLLVQLVRAQRTERRNTEQQRSQP